MLSIMFAEAEVELKFIPVVYLLADAAAVDLPSLNESCHHSWN